jgi:phosphoribosyl 1,2-cyclic phosphodiesterase
MFFAPAFRPDAEIVIWGPAAPGCPESSLEDRIARYISAPLSPVEVRELPATVSFRDAEPLEWRIGPATIQATSVTHRGPTLGYRVTEGDASVVYMPDHEPGLGTPLAQLEDEWISGLGLAAGADVLIHDAQYTDAEYPAHLGWGHSSLADALAFGRRAAVERLLLFHHDPLHSDAFLDDLGRDAVGRWEEAGGRPGTLELASERLEIVVGAATPSQPAP